MCGIVGWVSPTQEVQEDILVKMRDVMTHRGPNGKGIWISTDRRIGLAHRRLSIIDLSEAASQPMIDFHTGTVIIFNGEIYNHRELRCQLENKGIYFTTDHSDTEVLLKGYQYWGIDDLLAHINGMFAFAIFDRVNNVLIVARDRVGIKPLYLAKTEKSFYFASEAKALFESLEVSARLDADKLPYHLAFRSLPAPHTLFQGVTKLEPGTFHMVSLDNMDIISRRYWDPLVDCEPTDYSQSDVQDILIRLLEESVSYRLEADTKVGVFLSGGLDSAYLLNVARERRSQLDTFTVTYPGYREYDEGVSARQLAEGADAIHHEVPIDADSYMAALIDVAYHQDEPIAAPVCVPVYLLSKSARDANVPVVLAGEGSDELFIGYRSWVGLRDIQKWDYRIPDTESRLIRRTAAKLSGLWSATDRVGEFARRSSLNYPLFWGGAMDFSERRLLSLMGKSIQITNLSTYEYIVKPIWDEFQQFGDARDITSWMSYIDLRFRLPELMLPRLDKMGMAYSIEGRVPFLDHRVIEFVMGLKPQYRANKGKTTKPLFKSIATRRFSPDFVYQKKRGFQAPVKEWKAQYWQEPYLSGLKKFAERTELFDVNGLQQLIFKKSDRLYFSLINFMFWYTLYIDNVLEDVFGVLTPRVKQ